MATKIAPNKTGVRKKTVIYPICGVTSDTLNILTISQISGRQTTKMVLAVIIGSEIEFNKNIC